MGEASRLYDVSFERREGYLYARMSGDTSLSETKIECWDEIIRTCRAYAYGRLLVVLDGPGNKNELDAYESSRGIIALGLQGIKIAYVDLNPANLKFNQFGELVADNRGAFAKVFVGETHAEEWLLSERK